MTEAQSKTVMTPEQFTDRMSRTKNLDQETQHIEQDEIMLELLESLGYGEGVQVYKTTCKWYA